MVFIAFSHETVGETTTLAASTLRAEFYDFDRVSQAFILCFQGIPARRSRRA
jgi:hypothetical protein